jgi:RHS repeat-associated protein
VTNSCGTTTYDWDARNRLVGIDSYKPDCSPLTASFKYDALGRRIQKTTTHTGTVTDTMYLYDRLDIIQEIENGVVSVNYIRTLNIDEPLARIESSGTVRYYHADALGSIIALTDETGTEVTQYSYEPFGRVIISGEISDNPFQYTGIENDGTGLYYYRARYYNPKFQRFISEDPIGLAGGINLYSYVGNNSVNWIDPEGQGPIAVGVCVVAQLGNAAYTGYSHAQVQDEIAKLRKQKEKLAEKCESENIPAEQIEEYFDEIKEIDKQIVKKSNQLAKGDMWGYVTAGALTIYCGLSPYLPF